MPIDKNKEPDPREVFRMHAYLTMRAWQALSNEIAMHDDPEIGELEKDFINIACAESQTLVDNCDEFFDDIAKDQVGMALAQSGMAPHMEKWNEIL